MSFGRKGLSAGQAASAQGSGFGSAATAAAPAASAVAEPPAQVDDLAAKRAAFVAAERARSGRAVAPSEPAENADPLINLRNMSRPARPAQPMQNMPVGETGLPVDQEKEIRAMARGMSHGRVPPTASSGSGGRGGSSGFIFGDPQGRSVGLAYVLWFVLGQFSLHRFYCGQKDSAIMQVGLWVGSIVTLFIFPPIGLIGLVLWMCWIVGDLFMIPGMLKRFKAEHDYSGIFA